MSTRKTNIVVPSHRNDQTRTARFSSNRARIMINITQAVIDNHLSNSSPRCLQPVSRRQSRRHDRHGSRRSAANPHGTSSTRETKSAFVRVCALVNWSVYLRWNGDGSASGRSPWKIRFPQSLPGLPEGNKYGGALPLELRWLHLVVAVSYQKINTPVAHQYRGFFLETRSHPLRNDIFRGTIGLYRENTVDRGGSALSFYLRRFPPSLPRRSFAHPRSTGVYTLLCLCRCLYSFVQRWEKVAWMGIGKSDFLIPLTRPRRVLSFLLSPRFTTVSPFASFSLYLSFSRFVRDR